MSTTLERLTQALADLDAQRKISVNLAKKLAKYAPANGDKKPKALTVVGMAGAYLKANGFDGLYRDGECACLLSDLAPCDEIDPGCTSGYKSKCTSGEDCPDEAGDCDFHVGPERK